MKILHISTIIPWRGGDAGMLRVFDLLAQDSFFDQYILCPEGSVLAHKCVEQDIAHFTAPRKSKYSLAFAKKIIALTNRERFDCIHVHDSVALSLTLLALRFLPKTKLVYSRKRNNEVKNTFFKRLKYNNPRITKMICLSQAVKNVLLPIVRDTAKIEVIYDGIAVEDFMDCADRGILKKEYKIPIDHKIIGNIAGLTSQKDIYTFIDCAKIMLSVSDRTLTFVIVGEGKLREPLEEYALRLGVADHILFTGFRNDIKEILGEFDLLLMSSETEGLPQTILEAFAAGIPVVTTAAGGSGEAVAHGSTGMISPIKDPQTLAENAMEILDDAALRQKIVQNSRELVKEKFHRLTMGKNYADFYKSLV